MNAEQRAEASRLLAEGLSAGEVARRTGISRNTAQRMRQAAQPPAQSEAPPAQPSARPAQPEEGVGTPATWVVARPGPREADALGAYLALKGQTVEGWLAELAGKVARDVLGQADRVQAVTVITTGAPRHPLQAPRCPSCKGPVLVDATGRRCINRGCDWTGKA